MPIKCRNCDYENSDGQATCSVCGGDLTKHGVTVTSRQQTYVPVVQPPAQPRTSSSAPKPSSAAQSSLAGRPHLVESAGGRRYMLNTTATTTIGSQACAILLSGSGVQASHAQIAPSGTGFAVQGIQGGVVRVNGRTITGSHALQPGDKLEIGSVELVYHGPAAPATSGQIIPAAPVVPAAPKVHPLNRPPQPAPPAPSPSPAPSPIPAQNQPPLNPVYGNLGPPDLEGHVFYVDGPYMEPPDATPASCLFRAFMIPLMFTRFALPIALLNRGPQQVPVRMLRVRDQNGQERPVRVKGDYISGTINHGDDVAFWGDWRDKTQVGGTLNMRRAYNLRLSTFVRLSTVDTLGAQAGRVFVWIFFLSLGACVILSLLSSIFR